MQVVGKAVGGTGLLVGAKAMIAQLCPIGIRFGQARLMSDGTGRPAEFECHPDEGVEAIRWLICDAEVQ
jgi:hypothetical protein